MTKREYTDIHVHNEAIYMIQTQKTYKEIADYFGMPLSTVGWHMKTRLKRIDPELYNDVRNIVLHRKRRTPSKHKEVI